MPKEDAIKVNAIVKDILPSGFFKVVLENGHEILAHVSGKMRMHYIKILPGDTVTIEMSQYDISKGRILFRKDDKNKNDKNKDDKNKDDKSDDDKNKDDKNDDDKNEE